MTTIGHPFHLVEETAVDVLRSIGPYCVVANDPPWTNLLHQVTKPADVVFAGEMDLAHLESVASGGCRGDVIVGIGGGTAMDTAKFLAWKLNRPLVQIPSITSVDAGFTDAVGVRVNGNVKYIGKIIPEKVVLDIDMVCSAPRHLNRAGVGDILSCATGIFDWRYAADRNEGHPWNDELANLGYSLLDGLRRNSFEVRSVTPAGVRFLADSYRSIGAACAVAGHSRFEEGSEHFWAYAYEALTRSHLIHGEVISFAVTAMSFLQDGDSFGALELVADCFVRAHPNDLRISRTDFIATFNVLKAYVREQNLDFSFIDDADFSPNALGDAWEYVCQIPVQST